MNTRIGASRAHELEGIGAEHIFECTDDLSLDRSGILLRLPAGIARTFVFDRKTESCHGTR